jgi:hypothetical protein
MILRRYGSTAFLPLLLLCFSGCLHRKHSIQGNYTVEGNAGYPMLVPAFASTRVEGEFQTASVILQGARQANQTELNPGCAIAGDVFSLHPGNPADSKHWTIRSLSVHGWNLRGGNVDTEEQWQRFVGELARMQQHGCFPAGMSVFSLQRAFASAIPLPASDLQSFLYSANAEGFVNLSPGMQIKIEEMLASREVTGQIQSSYAYYQVVSSAEPGVTLRRAASSHQGQNQSTGRESNLYPHLADSFASAPLMRLFFESFAAGGSKRNAMLLGASHVDDLEDATRLLEAQGNQACADHKQSFVCVVFKDDSVSLLSPIRINEHLSFYPFGTQLAVILQKLPRDKWAEALTTVRVMRPLARGDYAEVLFPKTMEGARQLVLLPEDSVHWSQ